MLPAVVVVDTAPEANGRTRPYARHEVETAAREREVSPFYVSSSDESVVRISSTVGHSLRRGTKSVSYPLDARYRLQFFPPLLRDGVAAENDFSRLAAFERERPVLVYAREPMMHLCFELFRTTHALSRRILSSASASGLRRKSCASSCVSSPMAKYASCSRAHASQKGIPRISSTARWRHGLCVLLRTWQYPGVLVAWVKRTFLLRARDLLLVIRTPLVSTPATNRARTPWKDISSMETGIAAVRQSYDGRPVRPRRRLLGFILGGIGLGLHRYSLPSL
jgi:hypothetical protein